MTKKRLLLLAVCMLTAMTAIMAQPERIHTRNFTTRDGLGSNVVNCGVQDRSGYLWFGTNHGLTRFDGHRFDNFYVEVDGVRLIEGITHIVEDTTHNVLLMSGKDYRLLCFDLIKMTFVSADGMTFPESEDNQLQESFYLNRARELGIARGNRTDRRHDLHYVKLNNGREIFATIDNGFFIYDPVKGAVQHYGSADEQPVIESDYINGILLDRSGVVWLMTTFAGIYRIDMEEESIRYLQTVPNVRSFAQIDEDRIAVADMEGRLFCYNTVSDQSSLIFNNGNRVYAVSPDSEGCLWIGTRGGGIWILEGTSARHLDNLPARQIYDIAFSTSGTVWIATLDGGLIEGHKKTDGTYSFFQHLLKEKIHELDIDLAGRLWIATENGILRKNGVTDTIFNKCKVVCICHAPDGTVWAGSNGYGLLKITGDSISCFQVDNGFANNCVESVVCDNEGNVIAGTDQGISIISNADGAVHNIYSSQGIRANTYNENAILCTSNGCVFLGSLTGAVELVYSFIGRNGMEKNRQPAVTCIDINDTPRLGNLTGNIELAHDHNNLCFSFSSFIYNDMSSVVYSYWLEGIDTEWRPSTKESRALYTNLSPGRYRLHIRSRLADMTWSEECVYGIVIVQPWYWTWWARLLYLFIIAFLVWYEWHQYQQRLSLSRQLDQRLSALYAVEVQQEHSTSDNKDNDEKTVTEEEHVFADSDIPTKSEETAKQKVINQRNKEFIDKLDHLIQQNLLQSDLDVNYIAQEMCVSYSTLHRRIKILTGMSANEYVRKHRLIKALQLLRDGIPATEVAMECGFSSPSYFTRCFKSEYGILPSEV